MTPTIIFIAIVCIGAISMIIHANAKINSKSKVRSTYNEHLHDRQALLEATRPDAILYVKKPKSSLRGVQNKRFRKK